jgi:hypothetical protein
MWKQFVLILSFSGRRCLSLWRFSDQNCRSQTFSPTRDDLKTDGQRSVKTDRFTRLNWAFLNRFHFTFVEGRTIKFSKSGFLGSLSKCRQLRHYSNLPKQVWFHSWRRQSKDVCREHLWARLALEVTNTHGSLQMGIRYFILTIGNSIAIVEIASGSPNSSPLNFHGPAW